MAMYAAVKEHLQERGWEYDVAREGSLIKSGVKSKAGSFAVVFDVKEERKVFVLYIINRLDFPEAKRENIALYLTYANYGLTIGNFEIDMRDGEVRFKTSVDVTGSRLSPNMVEEMLNISIAMMDRYFENMIKVCYADLGPKEACEDAEKNVGNSKAAELIRLLEELVQ